MEVTHSPSFFVQTVTNYAMYIWYSSVNDDEKADLRGLRAAYNTETSSASTLVEVARDKTAELSATFNVDYNS